MKRVRDLTGERFGSLVIIGLAERRDSHGHSYYKCKCDCGKEKVISRSHLVTGASRSCGCKIAEASKSRATHGSSKSRLYTIWQGMKRRCNNKNEKSYQHYGGRGITVCNEWLHDFIAFKTWSEASGYSDELSIDRIDVNGNYSPENCRWIPFNEQARNRRNTKIITINGVAKTITEWCNESPVTTTTVYQRIRDGWSKEEAILTNDLRIR